MKFFGRTGFFARISMVDTCENHENSFLRGLAGAGGQGRVSGRATGPPERAYAPAFATDLSPAIRLLPAGLAEPGAAGGGAGIVAGGDAGQSGGHLPGVQAGRAFLPGVQTAPSTDSLGICGLAPPGGAPGRIPVANFVPGSLKCRF